MKIFFKSDYEVTDKIIKILIKIKRGYKTNFRVFLGFLKFI